MQLGSGKQLFNRVFLGITLLWFLYCAVFVPVQAHRRDEAAYSEAMANCLYGANHTASAPDAGCMVSAMGMHVIHQTEWRSYYGPGWWAFLLGACGALPLLVYLAIRASVSFLRKIRRIRTGIPPANRDDRYAQTS